MRHLGTFNTSEHDRVSVDSDDENQWVHISREFRVRSRDTWSADQDAGISISHEHLPELLKLLGTVMKGEDR